MPRCVHSTKRIRAFTLLEVMLAATMLALAFIGTAQVIISGSNMLDMSRKQSIAAQIIHTEIDQIKLYEWTAVNSWNATSSTIDLNSALTTSYSASGSSFLFGYPELLTLQNVAKNFTIVRTVAATSGRTDMKTITFTVTWKSNLATGKTFSRSGTTYFGKNGLFVTYKRS